MWVSTNTVAFLCLSQQVTHSLFINKLERMVQYQQAWLKKVDCANILLKPSLAAQLCPAQINPKFLHFVTVFTYNISIDKSELKNFKLFEFLHIRFSLRSHLNLKSHRLLVICNEKKVPDHYEKI